MHVKKRAFRNLCLVSAVSVAATVIVGVSPASAATNDMTTKAGTGADCVVRTSSCGDGANPLLASFRPLGVTTASNGDIYFIDQLDNKIRKITAATGAISTFAGTGVQGATGDGGPATSATFYLPRYLAVAPNNDVYISDYGNDLVRKVTASTGNITTVAGTTAGQRICGLDSQSNATAHRLGGPQGVTLDAAGNLFFVDTDCFSIDRVTPSGTWSRVAGIDHNNPPGDSCPDNCDYGDGTAATTATLYYPTDAKFDSAGNLYVSTPFRVRKIIPGSDGLITGAADEIISNFAGVAGSFGYTGDGGPAKSAKVNDVLGLAVDNSTTPASVYFADAGNNRVRKVNSLGTITTVAGTGSPGFVGDGGRAVDAQIYFPVGIALDPSGHLLISDQANYRIRRVETATAGNGFLQVVTSPSVNTEISVDGVVRDDWSLFPLIPSGPHTVCFTRDIEDFITPACQTVTVTPGVTTTVTGTFVQKAFLQIGTSPAGLTDAVISVDGTPRDNITMYTDLPVGSHQVCWGPVADLAPPACQTVNLNPPGSTVTVIGNYASSPGAAGPPASDGFLRAVTSPAVPSQISVDGVPRETWGTNWLRMAAGSHSVCYRNSIPGYTGPACQTVSVTSGATTTVTGTFVQKAYLHVGTNGLGDATISIDGKFRDNYDVYADLVLGSHEVCFGGVAGKVTPPCQTVDLNPAGATVTVTGTYI